MSQEPEWISVEDLIGFNQQIVASSTPPEPHLIVISGAIEAAQASPVNHYHYDGVEDIVALAAQLCLAVSRAHAFQQGNKRTGFVAMHEFLRINGYMLDVPDTTAFSDLMIRLLEDDGLLPLFMHLIDEHLVDVEDDDVDFSEVIVVPFGTLGDQD
jgi:death-on-curing protein